MKKVLSAALALVLALGVTACGGKETEVWTTGGDGWALQESAAFSEELEELDADTAFLLYKLSDAGLDRDKLSAATVRRSAGATCEEFAILSFDSEASAKTARDALEDYIQNQINANKDYRPAEIPKLENAWVDQRGTSLLMVVANDLNAAKEAVK